VQKGGLNARLGAIEYEMIVDALKTKDGNMSEAARELGLTRRILTLRMEKYGISYKDYRIVDRKQQSTSPLDGPATEINA
jgi:DNA-binding NtrC family response regulator